MRPTRLGVVGMGLIWSRVHQPHLARLQDVFELVAFCDVSTDRRAAIAADFPQARVMSDYHELLAMPEVEAVLVLTPIALNETVALDAPEPARIFCSRNRLRARSPQECRSSQQPGKLDDGCSSPSRSAIAMPTMPCSICLLPARSAI